MALAKTTGEIESIRGQFGGVYFKKDNAGQHIQTMPRHVYNTFGGTPPPYIPTHSFPRAAYINSFTAVAAFYAFMLSITVIPYWVGRVFGWISPDGKSKGKKLTAYQWWMKLNVPRQVENLPMYTDPPRHQSYLPEITVVGQFWGKRTVNMYEGKYHGKPTGKYSSDEWPVYIAKVGDTWWLAHQTELATFRWTRVNGDDPTGIYTPELEWQGLAYVNY